MKRSLKIGLCVFAAALFLTQYLAYQHYRIAKAVETEHVTHELASVCKKLKKTLSHGLAATKTLAFIVERYGVPRDFDAVARDILESNKYIDALELTEKGVITHVYPLQGNEPAVGFDVLRDSIAGPEAYKAIEKGELFFAGPIKLKQGGIAVIGRLPIYLDGEFFGFSVVLIKLSTLLQSIGIDGYGNDHFNYQLSKINPITQKEEFFLPDFVDHENEASVFVEVPDGEWKLYVSPIHRGFIYDGTLSFSLLGLVLSFMTGLFFYRWAGDPEKLNRLVEERTQELIASQNNSRTMLARISDAFIAVDKNLCFTYANKRAAEIFHFNTENVTGRIIWEEFPQLEGSLLYQALLKAMSIQDYVCTEFYFAEKERWLEAHVYPSPDGLSLFIRDITEYRRAKEELEASEKYFRALIENSADAIVLVDATGKVTYQSPSTDKISGYSLDEIQALDGAQLIHPDEREVAGTHFMELMQSPRKTIRVRHRLKHKSGHYIYIEGTYTNLLDDPFVKAIVYNYHDVTERVNAEQAIAREKFLSDSIINSLPGIFYLYNRDGEFIRWNKNFEVVSGYTPAEICDMNPLDFFTGEERNLLRQKIKSVFNNGRDEVEAFFHTKGGQKIPHYFNGSRVCIEGTEYLIGMGIDITDRLRAEEKVLAVYKEKETALNRISDGVVSLDREWRYHFINDAALATHPLGRERTLGKTMLEIHPELEGSVFWEMYQKAMKTMTVLETEAYYETMDIWFSAKAYPSEDGLTIYYKDISDRKKAEQETMHLIDSLQAKNRDLQQFSYIVSHNLRAPVANILGLTGLMTAHESPGKEHVQALADEAARLDQIIKDVNTIIAIRKMERNGMEPVVFEDELAWVKNGLRAEIASSQAAITSDFSGAPRLNSLKAYIQSILQNLLANAIKYRLPGVPLKIHVQTREEGEFVCLVVKDNGRGIDIQRNRDKIFGLYKRFHYEESIPGRGVGLNLVKTRAEALGGRVEVDSQVNMGAEFRVYLPLQFKSNARE